MLEEKIISIPKDFLDKNSEVQEVRPIIDQCDPRKLEMVLDNKEGGKRQMMEWKKQNLTSCISKRELVFRIYKNLKY